MIPNRSTSRERREASTRHSLLVPRTSQLVALLLLAAAPLQAQWVQQSEQFYLQAKYNWVFRDRYASADRLFNAFDYGHAILYEKLWTEPGAPTSNLEVKEYDHLTKNVLVRPPHVPLEEAAIEIEYVKLAPEAKLMFEWAHVLHRQLYDVLADERLTWAQKDAEVARLVAYYRSRPDIAFSSRPKTMELMQEQPYSLAFRKNYPKFNGLIWAYHWLQVGLYEPLLVGKSPEEKQSLVRATVARFWQMLERPVEWMPHVMPMTAAVAPTFAQRYPEAAIIFDNLHSMHDVISDILANPAVPRDRKRAEILIAARRFRDDTSFVTTEQGWRTMAHHMGLENMGGPAVGFLPAPPKPTVTYGAVMTHDPVTGEMTGFKYGSSIGGAHGQHGARPTTPDSGAHAGHTPPPAAPDTGRHAGHEVPAARADTGAHEAHHPTPDTMAMPHDSCMALHMRMMQDPVIRQRLMADTAMHRMMMQMMQRMPAEHRERMMQLMHGTPTDSMHQRHDAAVPVSKEVPPKRAPSSHPTTPQPRTPRPAARPSPKPAPTPADPHAGHHPRPQ